MTKFNIQGRGTIDLTKRNFLAQGGEGSVYVKEQTAYKIYCDDHGKPKPEKMIDTKKIKELSVLTHPNIIKPEDVIVYKKKEIGYTMKFVKDTYQLCQLFTNAFKKRNNLKPEDMMKLVQNLHEIVNNAHQHNILIVDLNEMNFLSDKDFKNIYAIDVDSWQTPGFPATAIMESIKDRHTKKFNKNSDWFSFGIVSFQMMVGIHPYKGKHPKIKDMETRMQKNISVFNKDVSVPKICLPFDVIPTAYKNWFKSIFEDGKREIPPTDPYDLVVVFAPKIKKITGSNNFDIRELREFEDSILCAFYSANRNVIITESNVFAGKIKIENNNLNQVAGFTEDSNKPVLAWVDDNKLKLLDLYKKSDLAFDANANQIMSTDGRIYIKNVTAINEIIFKEIGDHIFVTMKTVANVMDRASTLYEGVVVQQALGSWYVSIFTETQKSYQYHLKELDNVRIIDAKYQNKVLMIVVEEKGKYHRYILRFSDNYKDYDLREIRDIQYAGLNFTVLDKGVCISLNEDGTIELFSNKKDSTSIKSIDDSVIDGNMKLVADGNRAIFYKDNKVYKISLK